MECVDLGGDGEAGYFASFRTVCVVHTLRGSFKGKRPSSAEAGGFVADPDGPEKGPSSFLLQTITCLWASLLWPKRKMLSLSVTYF